MKVVLKETVYDRIKQELYKAYCNGREVDYIVVTPSELQELLCDRRSAGSVQYQPVAYTTYQQSVADITVKKREFPTRKRGYGNPYYTALSTYTFRDIDLFAVPEEFHPQ